MDYRREKGETDDELIYRICCDKDIIGSWDGVGRIINNLLGYDYASSTYRKKYQAFSKIFNANKRLLTGEQDYLDKLAIQEEKIRKERIKLQTLNTERTRLDRNEARQELLYEQIRDVVASMPVPNYYSLEKGSVGLDGFKMSYLMAIADIHYGVSFVSANNEYSPEIAKYRFEILLDNTYNFIKEKKISHLSIVCLGDLIQGILRINDLKANNTTVVKSIVEISRLISWFLVELSKYVKVDYYHVMSANHTQLRPIGSKANELMDEDLEYIIGNYILDLCGNHPRINVHMCEDGKQYICINIHDYEILAMHGHQVKNVDSAILDYSSIYGSLIDYIILGHFHGSKTLTVREDCTYDSEILVAPSFIGSDPYSDRITKGAKSAVHIYGFNEVYGHTETYKFILN